MNKYYKIKTILLPKEFRQACVLLVFILIAAILEMFSVGLILPIMAMVLTPESLEGQGWFTAMVSLLGNPGGEKLISYTFCAIILTYIIKTIYMITLAKFQFQYVYKVAASVSQRLFSIYLKIPYEFHLQRNSSILLRNLTAETTSFTNALEGTMVLITECAILLGLCSLLIYINPIAAITVGLIGALFVFGIHFLLKTKLLTLGTNRLVHEGAKNQLIMQGLGAVKEIKIMRRENGFLQDYKRHNFGLANVKSMQNFFGAAPRFFMELMAVLTLMGLSAIQYKQGLSTTEILSVLGVFAAAAFRILPSINRILVAKQRTTFMAPSIDVIFAELNMENDLIKDYDVQNKFDFTDMIEFSSISYRYPFTKKNVLNNLNFKIKFGESIGIIGGSGAGKSTLIDILLGLVETCEGTILIDGKNIKKALPVWQRQIGYVPQAIALTDDTIRRNVALGIPDDEIDNNAVISALKLAHLYEHILTLSEGINSVIGEHGVRISGGQRQRLGIARALYHDPNVLVLDESTSSLDNATEYEVMEAIKEMKGDRTVVIVAHRLSTIEHCDKVLRIDAGSITETISLNEFEASKL
jgi:ATP-binding cassette, subfamily B, bacterial PglK